MTPFLLIVAFVVVIYFVLLRPSRRRQQAARQQHQDMLSNVAPGTHIVTIGGLHGTVVANDGDSVTLEIAPGVTARYDRQAIAKVIPDEVDEITPATTYADEDDIVDGADLDSAHADADEATDTDASPRPASTPTDDADKSHRSGVDKQD